MISTDKKRTPSLLLLAFLITFVYEFLRPIKTALIVTAAGSSAVMLPYLRMWLVLPSSLLACWILRKSSQFYTRHEIFTRSIACFLICFASFILVYPWLNTLAINLHLGSDKLQLLSRHWPLCVFFVFAELWPTIILGILFWGYVNETSNISTAKNNYWALLFCGNTAAIVAGVLGSKLSAFGTWDSTVYISLGIITVLCFMILVLFKKLDINIRPQPSTQKQSALNVQARDLFGSKHILYLTLIVLAYNLAFNLVEVLWTTKVQELYPLPSQFSAYINQNVALSGVFALAIGLGFYYKVFSNFSWLTTAAITPLLLLIAGLIIFLAPLAEHRHFYQSLAASFDLSPMAFSLILGSIYLSLGRASKYTFFDQSKEMAFIPLQADQQRQAKLWIEAVVTRAGKFGAGLIYDANWLSLMLGSFLALMIICLHSTRNLGRRLVHTL